MNEPSNLEQVLDRMGQAEATKGQISVGAIVSAFGRRSFGPLLLLPGLVTLSPVGGIPGVPTLMAVLVLFVSVQLLLRRKSVWLPHWLLNRSVPQGRFEKSREWLRRPARSIDRLLRPRFTILTGKAGVGLLAILSLSIALMMPPMELIPFSALGAGLALTVFGLALLANDGLVALSGVVITLTTYWVVLQNLL